MSFLEGIFGSKKTLDTVRNAVDGEKEAREEPKKKGAIYESDLVVWNAPGSTIEEYARRLYDAADALNGIRQGEVKPADIEFTAEFLLNGYRRWGDEFHFGNYLIANYTNVDIETFDACFRLDEDLHTDGYFKKNTIENDKFNYGNIDKLMNALRVITRPEKKEVRLIDIEPVRSGAYSNEERAILDDSPHFSKGRMFNEIQGRFHEINLDAFYGLVLQYVPRMKKLLCDRASQNIDTATDYIKTKREKLNDKRTLTEIVADKCITDITSDIIDFCDEKGFGADCQTTQELKWQVLESGIFQDAFLECVAKDLPQSAFIETSIAYNENIAKKCAVYATKKMLSDIPTPIDFKNLKRPKSYHLDKYQGLCKQEIELIEQQSKGFYEHSSQFDWDIQHPQTEIARHNQGLWRDQRAGKRQDEMYDYSNEQLLDLGKQQEVKESREHLEMLRYERARKQKEKKSSKGR